MSYANIERLAQVCVLVVLAAVVAPAMAVSLDQYPRLVELANRMAGTPGLNGEQIKDWFRDAAI
ncbi:MAG: hypothetical protein ABGY05_13595, partial [Pseudomonadota bacterium]